MSDFPNYQNWSGQSQSGTEDNVPTWLNTASEQTTPAPSSLDEYSNQPFNNGPSPDNLHTRSGIKKLLVLGGGLLFILIVGVLLLTSGVLSSLFPDNGPMTLTYWGIQQPPSVMQPLILAYEAQHPNVTIKYTQLPLSQYRQTLQTRLSQGTGPDLFRFHSTWVPMLKSNLATVPSSIYSRSAMSSTFYPVVKEALSDGTNYYGIPLMYDGLALVYNATMFKAAGFNQPPQTWSELRQLYAPKLTSYNPDGTINVAGVALGTATNVSYFSDILGLLFLQNGVHFISNGQVAFADDIVTSSDGTKHNLGADALQFYTLFSQQNASGNGAIWDGAHANSSISFAKGRVAMIVVPSSELNSIYNMMKQSGSSFQVGVAPVPQALPTNEATPIYWANYWAEGVSRVSPHQQAAWEFLKFLSSKDSEMKLYSLEKANATVGEIPSRTDLASSFNSDPLISPYLTEAPYAKTWYLTSGTKDNGIDDQIISNFASAVTDIVSNTNADPVAIIKTAATGTARVLSQFGVAGPTALLPASQ